MSVATKSITRNMVDSLEWSTQDLQHMVFNCSNSLGGEETRYNIVGDVVDSDGFIHWYDSDGELVKSNFKVPEWAA